MKQITIVPTGSANLASVTSALSRVGAVTSLAQNTHDILEASALVLPGVGSFGAAMERLRKQAWREPLRARISDGVPVLAICLGMQILFESSEESPAEDGLGIFPGRFEQFPSGVQVPHVGWNSIEPTGGTQLLSAGDAYFTHSFMLPKLPNSMAGSLTDYPLSFVSAVETSTILACQFHLELSGAWGLELLRRWIAVGGHPC